MKRIWGYVVTLLAAGTVAGSVLPACATNDQSIFIRAVLAPSANRQGGSCVYNNDPQQATNPEPLLDIGLSDSYYAILLIGNQLIARGDPSNNRAESNRIHIDGAVVRVTEPDGTLIREFTSPATGFNDPQNNNSPGYSAIGLSIFDKPTRDIIAPQLTRQTSKTVLVKIKAFGTSLGGGDLESGEYQFPMQICRGCLVIYDGLDPAKVTVAKPNNCDKAPEANASNATTGPCRLGQDIAISCRSCRQSREVCDPNVP